jgi:two-component sensor histidine kinase
MAWPRISLQGRLLILTFVALAPAVALLGWTELQARRARVLETRELALRYGQLASLELVRIVDGIGSLVLATSHAPPVAHLEPGACRAFLAAVVTDAPQLRELAAVDQAGTPRCASADQVPPLSASNIALLAASVPPQGNLIVGTYQNAPAEAGELLPLIMPTRDTGGRVSGALVAYLDLGWLGARIKERNLGKGNSLTIADRDGTIIAREPYPERFVGTSIPHAFDYLLHATAPGTLPVISQDGTPRMLGYYPITEPPVGVYVSAGISESEAFRDIDAAQRRALAVMFAAGVATCWLAWTIGQQFIQRPVMRLLASIEAWRQGDLAVRTGMQARTGELEAVGEAFDGLIAELSSRQAAQEHAEGQRRLLMEELRHRVKNTLTIVQAIAIQSLRGAADLASARDSLISRLRALADAHDILTANEWEAANLHDVVARTVRPFQDGGASRFVVQGLLVSLQPGAALSLGLALHELSTNAVKYGALSTNQGRVNITWSTDGAGPDERFHLDWTEQGGPPVAAPENSGFGSRLIQRALGGQLGGTVTLTFAQGGLRCHIEAPLRLVAVEMVDG